MRKRFIEWYTGLKLPRVERKKRSIERQIAKWLPDYHVHIHRTRKTRNEEIYVLTDLGKAVADHNRQQKINGDRVSGESGVPSGEFMARELQGKPSIVSRS